MAIGLGGALFLVLVITAICCCVRCHRKRDTPATGINHLIIAVRTLFLLAHQIIVIGK